MARVSQLSLAQFDKQYYFTCQLCGPVVHRSEAVVSRHPTQESPELERVREVGD